VIVLTTATVDAGTVYNVVKVAAVGSNCPKTFGVSAILGPHQSISKE
jgi:hypothetical protein